LKRGIYNIWDLKRGIQDKVPFEEGHTGKRGENYQNRANIEDG